MKKILTVAVVTGSVVTGLLLMQTSQSMNPLTKEQQDLIKKMQDEQKQTMDKLMSEQKKTIEEHKAEQQKIIEEHKAEQATIKAKYDALIEKTKKTTPAPRSTSNPSLSSGDIFWSEYLDMSKKKKQLEKQVSKKSEEINTLISNGNISEADDVYDELSRMVRRFIKEIKAFSQEYSEKISGHHRENLKQLRRETRELESSIDELEDNIDDANKK